MIKTNRTQEEREALYLIEITSRALANNPAAEEPHFFQEAVQSLREATDSELGIFTKFSPLIKQISKTKLTTLSEYPALVNFMKSVDVPKLRKLGDQVTGRTFHVRQLNALVSDVFGRGTPLTRMAAEMPVGTMGVYVDTLTGRRLQPREVINNPNARAITNQELQKEKVLTYIQFQAKAAHFNPNDVADALGVNIYNAIKPQVHTLQPVPDSPGWNIYPVGTEVPTGVLKTVSYQPRYFVVQADPSIITVINNIRYAEKQPHFGDSLIEVANEHSYNNGSLLGQAGRYKTVRAVQLQGNRQELSVVVDSSSVNPVGILSSYYNTHNGDKPVIPSFKAFDDIYSYIDVMQNQFVYNSGTPSLIVMNPNSSTGLYAGNATVKNQTMGATPMACAQQLILSLVNSDNPELDFNKSGFALQALKPKAEVYSRQDFNKKTRNVCALSFPATVLLQLFQTAFFKCRKVEISFKLEHTISPGNKNLQGFSPVNSFFADMVREFRKAPNGHVGVWFMADNLFLAQKIDGDIHFISMDGSKMECSHDNSDVNNFLAQLRNFYGDVDEDTWKAYETIARSQMVGAAVLLGRTPTKTTWLSSGYPHTADLNCLKMARIVTLMVDIINAARGKPGKYTEVLKQHYKDHDGAVQWAQLMRENVNFCELAEQGYFNPVFRTEGVTMKVELYQKNILSQLTKNLYVDIDFLGFGLAAPSTEHIEKGIVYPTLSRHRLYKALMFSKVQKPTGNSAAHLRAIALSKMTSIFLVGGWLDDTARKVLRAAFTRETLSAQNEPDSSSFNALMRGYLDDFGMPDVEYIPNTLFTYQTINKILLSAADANVADGIEVDFPVGVDHAQPDQETLITVASVVSIEGRRGTQEVAMKQLSQNNRPVTAEDVRPLIQKATQSLIRQAKGNTLPISFGLAQYKILVEKEIAKLREESAKNVAIFERTLTDMPDILDLLERKAAGDETAVTELRDSLGALGLYNIGPISQLAKQLEISFYKGNAKIGLEALKSYARHYFRSKCPRNTHLYKSYVDDLSMDKARYGVGDYNPNKYLVSPVDFTGEYQSDIIPMDVSVYNGESKKKKIVKLPFSSSIKRSLFYQAVMSRMQLSRSQLKAVGLEKEPGEFYDSRNNHLDYEYVFQGELPKMKDFITGMTKHPIYTLQNYIKGITAIDFKPVETYKAVIAACYKAGLRPDSRNALSSEDYKVILTQAAALPTRDLQLYARSLVSKLQQTPPNEGIKRNDLTETYLAPIAWDPKMKAGERFQYAATRIRNISTASGITDVAWLINLYLWCTPPPKMQGSHSGNGVSLPTNRLNALVMYPQYQHEFIENLESFRAMIPVGVQNNAESIFISIQSKKTQDEKKKALFKGLFTLGCAPVSEDRLLGRAAPSNTLTMMNTRELGAKVQGPDPVFENWFDTYQIFFAQPQTPHPYAVIVQNMFGPMASDYDASPITRDLGETTYFYAYKKRHPFTSEARKHIHGNYKLYQAENAVKPIDFIKSIQGDQLSPMQQMGYYRSLWNNRDKTRFHEAASDGIPSRLYLNIKPFVTVLPTFEQQLELIFESKRWYKYITGQVRTPPASVIPFTVHNAIRIAHHLPPLQEFGLSYTMQPLKLGVTELNLYEFLKRVGQLAPQFINIPPELQTGLAQIPKDQLATWDAKAFESAVVKIAEDKGLALDRKVLSRLVQQADAQQ